MAESKSLRKMTLRRWVEYSAAVLVGNAIYFLVLYPGLPRVLQHQAPRPDGPISPIRLDLGLLLDFLCCVAVYGVIRLGVAHARRWNERSRRIS